MNTIETSFDAKTNSMTLTIHCNSVIKDIYMDNQRTFNCNEEHSTSAWHLQVTDDIWAQHSVGDGLGNYIFTYTINLTEIDATDLVTSTAYDKWCDSSIEKDLFFVYIKYENTVTEEFHLVYWESYLRNLIFDSIYDSITVSACSCDLDTGSINQLLLYNGFKFASLNKDKVYFWNMIHTNKTTVKSKCNCNG